MVQRQTFGVLINQLAGGFQAQLWPGLYDGAKEEDANVIFYCGKIPKLDYNDFYQHEAVFHLVDDCCIDGLVSLTVAVGYAFQDGFDEYMDRYAHIPTVSLCKPLNYAKTVSFNGVEGTKESIKHLIQDHGKRRIAFVRGPETHSDASDHYQGYCEALQECGLELDESIVVSALMDKSGGWQAAETLLSRRLEIDAISTSNDEQAIGVLHNVRSKGINIPNDIAITGHDNILETTFNVPKITTVNQPTFEMGYVGAKALGKLLRTGESEDVVLQTHLVRRESCGCFSDVIEDIQEDYMQAHRDFDVMKQTLQDLVEQIQIGGSKQKYFLLMLDNIICSPQEYPHYQLLAREFQSLLSHNPLKTFDNKILHRILNTVRNAVNIKHEFLPQRDLSDIERNFVFLRTSLNYSEQAIESTNLHEIACNMFRMRDAAAAVYSAMNLDELADKLEEEIHHYDINECYVSLYEEHFVHRLGGDWIIPKRSKMIFAAQEGKAIAFEKKEVIFETTRLMPDWLKPTDRRFSWAVMPLFTRDKHYGVIILGMDDCQPGLNDERFESLRDIVSTVVENVSLYQKITSYQELLEEKNARLHKQAVTDELTSLYNRHGFMSIAPIRFVDNKRTGTSMAIIFADMDGLKVINDTYGHAEGDKAIKIISEVLTESFRSKDLIARLAGDEFVILMSEVKNESSIRTSVQRLNQQLHEINCLGDHPYEISLSIGHFFWNPSSDPVSLDDVMAKADEQLYRHKRQKKSAREDDKNRFCS